MLELLYHDERAVALRQTGGTHRRSRPAAPPRASARCAKMWPRSWAATSSSCTAWIAGRPGVLLFAVTAEAHRALSMAFERHQIDKRYWGLCRGTLVGSGEVDRALVPIRGGRVRPARPGESAGKPSVTAWRAIERFARSGEGGGGGEGSGEARAGGGEGWAEARAVAEAREVGAARAPAARRRSPPSSCARVPAACIRCVPTSPSSATPWPSTPTTAAPSACSPATSIPSLEAPAGDELVLSRVPLHAERVRFRHPTTGKPVEIAAPLPPDLERVVTLLRR